MENKGIKWIGQPNQFLPFEQIALLNLPPAPVWDELIRYHPADKSFALSWFTLPNHQIGWLFEERIPILLGGDKAPSKYGLVIPGNQHPTRGWPARFSLIEAKEFIMAGHLCEQGVRITNLLHQFEQKARRVDQAL